MKAWLLNIKHDDDQGQAIVFAPNRTEAKKRLWTTHLEADSWIDIEARRYPVLDNMENAGEVERALILWRDGWRWYDYETPEEEETTDDEFKEWYLRKIMGVQE